MNEIQETYETTAMNYHNKTEETTFKEDVQIDRYIKTTTGTETTLNFSIGKNDRKFNMIYPYYVVMLYVF